MVIALLLTDVLVSQGQTVLILSCGWLSSGRLLGSPVATLQHLSTQNTVQNVLTRSASSSESRGGGNGGEGAGEPPQELVPAPPDATDDPDDVLAAPGRAMSVPPMCGEARVDLEASQAVLSI